MRNQAPLAVKDLIACGGQTALRHLELGAKIGFASRCNITLGMPTDWHDLERGLPSGLPNGVQLCRRRQCQAMSGKLRGDIFGRP